MEIKTYKYNQSIKRYNQLFEKKNLNEVSGFILLQSNGITGKQLNRLTKDMLYNNINLVYITNIIKKSIIQSNYLNSAYMNNEIFIVKVNNILQDLNFFFNYLKQGNIEHNLLRLNLLLNINNKLTLKSIYYYEKYLQKNNLSNKADVYAALFKMLRIKLISVLLKLKTILNANIQSIKKR